MKGSGCLHCGVIIGMLARTGAVETRYNVAEFDARPALNIFICFEGVNSTMNRFSRLSLQGRLPGVTGSVNSLVVSVIVCASSAFHAT